MKKTMISVIALGAIALLLGLTPQGSMDEAIQQLRQEVAQLGLRVAQLEHAGGAAPTAVASTATATAAPTSGAQAGSPVRTMVLMSVSQSNHSSDNAAKIAQLQRKSDSLMNTVNQYADAAGQAAGQDITTERDSAGERGYGQASGSTVFSTNIGAAGRQVFADQQLGNRYATEAYIAREKAKKLQAADAKPKQVIHGHSGQTVFTLETTHDLSEQLNSIAIGDTVTWRGNRIDADETSETWNITSIQKVN